MKETASCACPAQFLTKGALLLKVFSTGSLFHFPVMISHPLARCGALLLTAAALTTSAFSQPGAPAPAADAKIDLSDDAALDEKPVKLDPTPLPDAALPGTPGSRPSAQSQTIAPIPGLANLTPEQRQTVGKGLAEVAAYMRGVRLQESLEKLNEVEAITGEFHIVTNMRGAIYTKMRDFKSARVEFRRAIELTADKPRENFHPRFNLAEINFVEKNWEEARKAFTKLLEEGSIPDPGTRRLMEYKVMICLLQEKKTDEAMAILEKFDQYDHDSPAYYFGMAAVSFANDKKEEAEEWLGSSAKIYPKELNDVYQDSLVEAGWLQTLQ